MRNSQPLSLRARKATASGTISARFMADVVRVRVHAHPVRAVALHQCLGRAGEVPVDDAEEVTIEPSTSAPHTTASRWAW